MRFILAVYTQQIYKELHLPAVDNMDYTLLLRADECKIKKDIRLLLEVAEGEWRFRPSNAYRVLANDRIFEQMPLKEGQMLKIKTRSDEEIMVFVWKANEKLVAFKKYRVIDQEITIGSHEGNNISYKATKDMSQSRLPAVSRRHAVLQFINGTVKVLDQSTNGIFLNNQRIQDNEVMLHFGDYLNLFEITIVCLGEFLAINSLGGELTIDNRSLQQLSKSDLEEKTQKMQMHRNAEQKVHISPRKPIKIYNDNEKIDPGPTKNEGEKRSVWLSVLPSLTMALPMILGYSLMNRMGSGMMAAGMVISVGSAVVGVAMGLLNYRATKKENQEKELLRLKKYEEYLVRCADSIRQKFEHNRKSMLQMYPDAETCSQYLASSPELWARQSIHSDFLYIRLGLGELPFQVKIEAPCVGFSMMDDELAERPRKIVQNFEKINGVPVGISLAEHGVIGLLGDHNSVMPLNLARIMITQIAANHSYADVRIAVLYNGDGICAKKWDFIRWIPHVWNEERSMRYIASNNTETNDVLYALTQVLRSRAEKKDGRVSGRGVKDLPHYILFVEDSAMLESQIVTKYLYEQGSMLGITTVIMADAYEKLPSACSFVVEHSTAFCGMYSVEESGNDPKNIEFDTISDERIETMAHNMSSLRVVQIKSNSDIPTAMTFFDMFGIRSLDDLNVLDRWRKNRTYDSMRALVGKKAGGADCYLDINEKYHGPHGLVAGTTGSGKSETVQTYILSLAVNYSPQDVGFLIIDFKGGGMANLFDGLPHMTGKITNLSGNQIRRAMVSLRSENERRMRIFQEYGINHIDQYTKLIKNREASEPIPHLLIVIDEFAELKREESDFMSELVSIAQVGRSLGVHLILATQKPSTTVDANIWSNSRFKLCLRVADKQDSNEMLHKPDAAYLTQPGRCYLQVGNDELYELFQSGWSGAVFDKNGLSGQRSAELLDLQGREAVIAARARGEQKKRAVTAWISEIVSTIVGLINNRAPGELNKAECENVAAETIKRLNLEEERLPDTKINRQRLTEMMRLWPKQETNTNAIARHIIAAFEEAEKKLPQEKEKTQLRAIVEYLAEIAVQTDMSNLKTLWLPNLPEELYLEQLSGYQDRAYCNGKWKQHEDFELNVYMGYIDDPANQMQFPLTIDLAVRGHLAIVGGVSSGKSTFLQTMAYSLISCYSPEEVNIYAIDFSSQMMSAFEKDAHTGCVVLEGEDERLDKLFHLLNNLLQERKQQIRGGSFSQYIRLHGHKFPAVVLMIDGYANFREKTGQRFDNILQEFARSAEGFGIYLVIACNGFGGQELQMRISDNIRQTITLELGEKGRYIEALRVKHIDLEPAANVKGRGLVVWSGSVLEYQTALSCSAENDYARSEWLRKRCAEMSTLWKGKRAMQIPEIPEKPTWKIFSAQESYQSMIRAKQMLPVAYKQGDASLYAVDLSRTFCYLVLGRKSTGKTVFLRNLMCAAHDMESEIILVDPEYENTRLLAEQTGLLCASTPQEYFEVIKRLMEVSGERAPKRRELRNAEMEREEIWQAMSDAYPPLFCFITNLRMFFDSLYTSQEGIGMLNRHIEHLTEKAQDLNMYFFAATNIDDIPALAVRPAYLNYIKEKNGVLLGGELDKQNWFQYQNIRDFNEKSRRMKPGRGYAMNQQETDCVDMIVIPQNKGMTEK